MLPLPPAVLHLRDAGAGAAPGALHALHVFAATLTDPADALAVGSDAHAWVPASQLLRKVRAAFSEGFQEDERAGCCVLAVAALQQGWQPFESSAHSAYKHAHRLVRQPCLCL